MWQGRWVAAVVALICITSATCASAQFIPPDPDFHKLATDPNHVEAWRAIQLHIPAVQARMKQFGHSPPSEEKFLWILWTIIDAMYHELGRPSQGILRKALADIRTVIPRDWHGPTPGLQLWSGNAQIAALEYALKVDTSHRVLEATALGMLLNNVPINDFGTSAVWHWWGAMSHEFAESARETVYVFLIEQPRPASVFLQTELPALTHLAQVPYVTPQGINTTVVTGLSYIRVVPGNCEYIPANTVHNPQPWNSTKYYGPFRQMMQVNCFVSEPCFTAQSRFPEPPVFPTDYKKDFPECVEVTEFSEAALGNDLFDPPVRSR